ncbi:MAG: GPR endopeptidase [Clostridia bacterium]|nr:GPR endopeptidase [Clostridia bacterium]
MSFNARTDLAIEAREMYFENSAIATEAKGIEAEEDECDFGIKVTRVRVVDEEGGKALGKPVGTYITMELPNPNETEQKAYEEACRICAVELTKLVGQKVNGTALVIGLGNRNITADALGPKTVDSVLVTRHLLEYMPEEIDSRLRSVCAISPGVLGVTGVETGEIVKGICDRVKPALVIAVDALCSRRMERINNTVQLTDTGVVPGAGIGNRRMAIDESSLGVPVIAIGVPTVIDAATIAGDTIDKIIENLKENAEENLPLYKMLSVIAEEDKYGMIKQVLKPDYGDFVVTPKEVDSVVENIAKVIANGINIALHEGITLEDIDRYR